jgi:hypothetical protein
MKLIICLVVAFVAVVVLIAWSLKKEKFEFDSMYRMGLGKPVMTFDEANFVNAVDDVLSTYTPTYTSKIKIKDFYACPPGTYEMPDGRCLTSRFVAPVLMPDGSLKCPRNTMDNKNLDVNMRCVTGYSDKFSIGGLKKCYDTQTSTVDGKCVYNDETVFTTRMFVDGKWVCPPGTKDTGIVWSEGKNGAKQCIILP